MTRDRRMDDVFERLLPSASEDQIEGARLLLLERVRAGAVGAEPVSMVVPRLNHGDHHILLVLSGGDRHGYAIMAEVADATEGATKFGPGTLHTAIKRLLTAGLIEESRNQPDPKINNEPRSYYRLTGMGEKVLARESERLAARPSYTRDSHIVRPI
jgi:DNA-binding PadR family transcriptional regulator